MKTRKAVPQIEPEPLTTIIADGLDASVNGRGWGKEHQSAMNLANAAPELLAALNAMLAYGDSEFPENKRVAVDMAFSAIRKAKGGN